jgi:DNA-binding response OmpR family regulator
MVNPSARPADAESIPPIILLVEDDHDSLGLHRAHLEMSGMWVATSSKPAEAIGAADDLKPDVIITDVGFSGQPLGLELVRTLKSRPETQRIPLILLSGSSVEQLPPDARRVADLCLLKPVLPERLLETVRGLLVRSAALRQRGDHAREKAHRLSEHSAQLLSRGRDLQAKVDQANVELRVCPECHQPLEWVERGRIGQVEYDYYRWCERGCGLYCYRRGSRKWVRLA